VPLGGPIRLIKEIFSKDALVPEIDLFCIPILKAEFSKLNPACRSEKF
jgi:hypothetical protein